MNSATSHDVASKLMAICFLTCSIIVISWTGGGGSELSFELKLAIIVSMSFSFSVLFFLYSISTKLHAEAEEIGSYSNPATSTESVKRDPHKKNAPSKKAKKKSKCFVCFINIEPEKKICADCATLENDKIFRIARK